MIHYYKSRRYPRFGSYGDTIGKFKLLCTNEYAPVSHEEVISVPHRVTCPKCLDLLIPVQERVLAKLRENRAQSQP